MANYIYSATNSYLNNFEKKILLFKHSFSFFFFLLCFNGLTLDWTMTSLYFELSLIKFGSNIEVRRLVVAYFGKFSNPFTWQHKPCDKIRKYFLPKIKIRKYSSMSRAWLGGICEITKVRSIFPMPAEPTPKNKIEKNCAVRVIILRGSDTNRRLHSTQKSEGLFRWNLFGSSNFKNSCL